MKILVTGAAGRLGSRLLTVLAARGHEVTGADIVGDHVIRLDIGDFETTRKFVVDFNPQVIVHPAAWTDVDGCAKDPEKAIAINGFGTQHVAVAAANIGAAVLYVSSNEVFDGRTGRPYREYVLFARRQFRCECRIQRSNNHERVTSRKRLVWLPICHKRNEVVITGGECYA